MPFSHLTHASRSLEKLAAKVMEQAGVLKIGPPGEAGFARIKKFADQFLNADSQARDIKAYETELTVVMDEIKVCNLEVIWTKLN